MESYLSAENGQKSPRQQRAWAIPNSNNQWAAGRRSVTLPDECDHRIFIDFGMIKQGGGNISGRLNVDDIQFRCDSTDGLPPQGGNWNFLPQIPEQDSSVVVPQDQLSLVTGEGNLVVAALILLSILLFLLKLRRS